jgi:hypothetical protein
MAIVQISRIQQRRGLQQDLPQLASAEMGWSLDTRRLFIGNGTLEEGAPSEGVTEILTERSDFLGLISSYTFAGAESGYTSVTGPSPLSPITRSLQNVLDETVTVKHFGAVGDGNSPFIDTAAINRAIRQIYVSTLNPTYSPVRRTIKFPAGIYRISSNIVIPPNTTLIGDGKNNTIIEGTSESIFITGDSLFQTGGALGAGGATLPSNISITGMTLRNTGTAPALNIYNTTDILVNNCYISGNVSLTGNTNSVKITNSTITGQNTPVSITGASNGFVSENNYYPDATTFPIANLPANSYSVGDTFGASDSSGVYAGVAKTGAGRTIALATGTTAIATLANGAATIDYEIVSGNNYRFGTFKYNRSAGVLNFDDEYTEPAATIGANLYASSTGVLTCTVGSNATLKYNIKQFI